MLRGILFTVILFNFINPLFLFPQTTLTVGNTKSLTQSHSSTLRCQVELTEPCEISINIQGWLNTLNWETDFDRIYIYNSENKTIGFNLYGSEDDPFLFHMMGNPDSLVTRIGKAGTYFIDFHSGSDWGWPVGKTGQDYTVLITTKTANDIHEPNDDLGNATLVDFDATYEAYQWNSTRYNNDVTGDEDYYLCNVPSSGKLKIILSETWNTILNWSADFDRLYVYDESGNAIGGSGNDPYYEVFISGKEISIDLETAGNYIVCLHSGWAYSTNPYSVTFKFESVTDVEDESELPNKFELSQNFPNPFNPTTTIKYSIPLSSGVRGVLKNVTLKVYDILGNEIAVLVNEVKQPGVYEVQFDAGKQTSGVYYYQLITDNYFAVKRMVLIK